MIYGIWFQKYRQKAKIEKWTSSLKTFAHQKKQSIEWKDNLQTEKIFGSHLSDKKLIKRIHKEV